MGILQGQETMLFEGDCYNYLMEQFCEDVYFAIASKTGEFALNAGTCKYLFNGDMTQYLEEILYNKAPEGFLSYLIENEYISVHDYRIEDVIDELWQKYDANGRPAVKKPIPSYEYAIYFKWKMKSLFYDYDIAGIRNTYNELKTIKL